MDVVLFYVWFSFSWLSSDTLPVTGKDDFRVINSSSNTLYLGIDNYIYLPACYRNPGLYWITTNNGHIFTDSASIHIIPRRLPDARVNVYSITGGDTLLVESRRFFTSYVPKPCVLLAGKCLDTYQGTDRWLVINNPELGIFISNDIDGANEWVSISSITLGVMMGRAYKSLHVNGNTLSEEMKQLLQHVRPGHAIDIKVNIETQANISRYLPVYTLVVY